MELEFKKDVDAVRKRWAAFWRGESPRPLLHALRPKSGVAPVQRPRPYDCAFGELDPIIDQTLAWAATHDFLADTIPSFMITFAPDHFSALLGAEIRRGGNGQTNWIEPCLESLDDAEIAFQREGRWWRRTVECIERFRARCDGRLVIAGTHLQGGLDCLAALYGTQNLLTDIAMAPRAVLRALGQVDQALADVRAALGEVLDVATWGSLNRFWMYSEGIIDVPQCDVSCMISPEMFDAFERPSLVKELAGTDASIYHLDGPDALQHLTSLCGIDHLDMIQWMPGEGHYEDDWSELNAEIDALGKGQIFQDYYKLTAADIERIWATYRSRKLFFPVSPDLLAQLPWS